MLHVPKLAFCHDRTSSPQEHLSQFVPERWFPAEELSAKYGLLAFSFDYYIDWSVNRFTKEDIWIKRIVAPGIPWPQTDHDTVRRWILQCDGENALVHWARFRRHYGVKPRYMLFPDVAQPTIVSAVVAVDGTLEEMRTIQIKTLMQGIQRRSGGPQRIGPKGLKVSTSLLECYLARTTSPWAGDIDLLLVKQEDLAPVAIIELKKHTLSSPIEDQVLSNYYPRPDGRKYDRLALLSQQLTAARIPMINLYYATSKQIESVKLERITNDFRRIRSVSSRIIPFTYRSAEEQAMFKARLMEAIFQLC